MSVGITDFRHVAIVTTDLARMVDFYAGVLGFDVLREFTLDADFFGTGVGVPGASARLAHLRVPGSTAELELLEFAGRPTDPAAAPRADERGYRHITLVVDDIDAAVQHLTAHGVELVSDPIRVGGPAAPGGFAFVYCRDPEGNIVELNQDGAGRSAPSSEGENDPAQAESAP